MEYDFVPVSSLPAVDLSKTMVAFLLTPAQHAQFLNRCSRSIKACSLGNRIGLLFAVTAICAPRTVGHAVAVPSLLLCIPNMLLTIVVSNPDLFRILMREYEFWIFTLMNAACWLLMSGTLGDIRRLICIPCWINTQLTISIDANIRNLHKTLPGSMIWVPGAVCICIVTFIPVIDVDQSHFDSLLPPGHMVLTRINVLTNTIITLCLHAVRRCYTKRSVLHKEFATTRLIPCAIIRAKLRMRRRCQEPVRVVQVQPNRRHIMVQRFRLSGSMSRLSFNTNSRIHPSSRRYIEPESIKLMQQLELVPRDVMTIDATQTVFLNMASASSSRPLHPVSTVLLYTIGLVGLVLSAYGVCQTPAGTDSAFAVACTALGATIAFMTPFVLSYQRAIVKVLAFSLDIIFLWTEAALGWLTFSYAIQWDARSLAALSALLWVQFVLFVDALTPAVRARLRFHKALLTPVILLIVVSAVAFLVNGASDSVAFIPDRDLFCAQVLKKSRCLQIPSFVLHRLFALVLATSRLLWVLPIGSDQELVFLRAVVRFVSPVEMLPFHQDQPQEANS